MTYHYASVNEIDSDTLDYLEFVAPFDLSDVPVTKINNFLTRIDECFEELDTEILDSH